MMAFSYVIGPLQISNSLNAASYFMIGKLSRSHLILDSIDNSWILESDLCSTNGGQIANHGRLFFFRQQPDQQRLLSVHAVFRLLEDDAPVAVEDIAGDFFAAMSGKTVHDPSLGRGRG